MPPAATDGGNTGHFSRHKKGTNTQMITHVRPQINHEVTPQAFTRCPGCYNWMLEATAAFFAPGMLDDHKSYLLCETCAHVLRNSDSFGYETVQRIFRNIGAYAGWSPER